jgi:prevent-host-death family protein
MDVGVTELRANLSLWLARAAEGEQVVITDRGLPVARLLGIEAKTLLEDLESRGVISRPVSDRQIRASSIRRVKTRGASSLSDLVSEQRD